MAEAYNSSFTRYFLVLVLCMVAINLSKAEGGPEAIFVFGDSTVDVGTNNFLNGTISLANFPYYGIDFPNSISTGRFSNGYNLADQLAKLFGYEKSPQPYLYLVNNNSLFREEIIRGVNFASGGCGILYQTGKQMWHVVVPVSDQIQQFALVRGNISELKGEEETARILSNSIFILSVGSNDILDNFRLRLNFTKDQLMATLHSAYYQHLKDLYNLGARKFGIIPAGPLGCGPNFRALNKTLGGDGGCMREPNEFARAFYTTVFSVLRNISSEFPEMKYSVANMYKMTKLVFNNHHAFGFSEIKKACCGSGYFNGEGACNKAQNSNLCANRNEYLFWDFLHPSEAATNLSASVLYSGGQALMKPTNFSILVEN